MKLFKKIKEALKPERVNRFDMRVTRVEALEQPALTRSPKFYDRNVIHNINEEKSNLMVTHELN